MADEPDEAAPSSPKYQDPDDSPQDTDSKADPSHNSSSPQVLTSSSSASSSPSSPSSPSSSSSPASSVGDGDAGSNPGRVLAPSASTNVDDSAQGKTAIEIGQASCPPKSVPQVDGSASPGARKRRRVDTSQSIV